MATWLFVQESQIIGMEAAFHASNIKLIRPIYKRNEPKIESSKRNEQI